MSNASLLVAVAVVLLALTTVLLAGTLRGLADIRLSLEERGHVNKDWMAIGLGLPDALLASFSERGRRESLVVMVSGTCGACLELLPALAALDPRPLTYVVSVDGYETVIPDGLETVAPDVATAATLQMQVDATPVVIYQRDGFIAGSAHGPGAAIVHIRGLLGNHVPLEVSK